MAKGIAQRLRDSHGFSLTEMLAVVVILTLSSMVMATGMPSAIHAYEEAVDAANAQTLLSTTIERLRDELSVADTSPEAILPINVEHIEDSESDTHEQYWRVTYTSFETGCETEVRDAITKDKNKEYEGILVETTYYVQPEVGDQLIKPDKKKMQLAPSAMRNGASTIKLVCKFSNIEYDDKKGVFKASLYVVRGEAGSTHALATATDVTIRPIA